MNKTKIIQDIVINLKGITDSLQTLSQVLNESQDKSVGTEDTSTKSKTETKGETKDEVKKALKFKQPTIEEVRAAMAEKNRQGHREEIKAILLKYDCKKLTSLDEKHYTNVLKEVGEIK